TVTAMRYRQELIDLNHVLYPEHIIIAQRKCKVILLHDNVRPHVAKIIKDTLSALQWEILPHAAYSPDC
ncbi:Histone-lysine N-methyltransferase SETMAR, partial [Harpegnathos saltator]